MRTGPRYGDMMTSTDNRHSNNISEAKSLSTKEEGNLPNRHKSGYQCSDIYDQDHPDADWSGFVPKPCSKKHYCKDIPRAVKVQLNTSEDNLFFAPREDADTHDDWMKKPRKRSYPQMNNNTFSLIGGPVPMNDPNAVGPKSWVTTARAATSKVPTDLSQLTHNGRSMHVRGLKKIEPRSASNSNVEALPNTVGEDGNTSKLGSARNPDDLIGFRTPCGATKSLLSGLGKELAKEIKCTRYVSPAPYATDGNVPTDPYMTATGERRKDMLVENYSSVVPGYTGTHRPQLD